ncbi:sugar transferase [Curtobacterium sp. MCJR17_055]|uniref:sugar transferase n=1 Tax=unclassified Curtobacterium TaxID=257496 RepID=UPI000D97462B|nr:MULTISPECIES: sugar transferase [unclassified Curtobacterium]PYY33820.1 sugar transferase [Curtobacterium sp. MCBD17_029]PYY58710.1 sugar transferase [Curtobacterium sp. MCJR17_055]PYY59749.1 sugar transferase [Curtobacterium sp. MCPF17_015]WIB36415.1 sugar transferase [Curtobacterium sp. MCJR17_043]
MLPNHPYDRTKRVLDVIAALVLLVLSAPVWAIVTVALLIVQGRPVFFRQRRTGLHGSTFSMLKFRTMLPDTDGSGTASDHLRVTPLGAFLRATSLDELPNLLNVLCGEMSIVGPRPMLAMFIEHHAQDGHGLRHAVRPGITGLAQVNGRNDLEYVRRFEYDLEYVRRRSLGLDFVVLLRTVPEVLARRGASGAEPCALAATDDVVAKRAAVLEATADANDIPSDRDHDRLDGTDRHLVGV